MNKIYVGFLVAFTSLTFGCNSTPTRRVHAAASIPRFVDFNPAHFAEVEPAEGLGWNMGAGYGLAWSDAGDAHGSKIYHLGVHWRNPRFSFAFTPYLGYAQASYEGTGVLGSVLSAAVFFGGGNEWRFSYQNTFAAATKRIEDQGCENDIGIFTTTCGASPISTARAETKIREVGFVFTAERRIHGASSLVISPALYWTYISASNQLDASPAGNTALRTHFWGPGLQLGYVARFGDRPQVLAIMAGAQGAKTFRPGRVVWELAPSANLRYTF